MESQSPKIINEYVEKDKFFSEAFKENDGKNSNIQSRMSNNIREKQVLATFSGKSIQAKWTNNTSNLNEQLINNNKPWSLVLGSRSLTKERLKHELRCRSCFQPLVPHQISQCSHSHFFCLECTEQVNACCVCNINGRGPKRRLRSANNTPIIISAAEFENICPCCFARFYEWDDRHFKERPKCQELMLEQSEAGPCPMPDCFGSFTANHIASHTTSHTQSIILSLSEVVHVKTFFLVDNSWTEEALPFVVRGVPYCLLLSRGLFRNPSGSIDISMILFAPANYRYNIEASYSDTSTNGNVLSVRDMLCPGSGIKAVVNSPPGKWPRRLRVKLTIFDATSQLL